MVLSKAALDLVLEFEVAGEDGYNKRYRNPIWPGEASGVTIGIGYDLGFVSPEQFVSDFRELDPTDRQKLESVCGRSGQPAKAALASVRSIVVDFDIAIDVFQRVSVPRYQSRLEAAMPGVQALDPDIQGALWSLVYNRGASMDNTDRRKEMRQIRDAVAAGKPELIPGYLRSMVRLWIGTSIEKGMRRRREAEAALIESALAKIRAEVGGTQVGGLPPLSRVLKLGSVGDDVRALQTILKDMGLLQGEVDGDFGPDTLQAVRKFQLRAGLDVDGQVGEDTWSALGGELTEELREPSVSSEQMRLEMARIAAEEGALGLSWTNAQSQAEKYLKPLRKPMQQLGQIGSQPVFYNWCAAFVTYCARKAGFEIPDVPPGATATVALADTWRSWAIHSGNYYKRGTTTPRRGDIVVFEWQDGDSQIDHIGIVTGFNPNTNKLSTSEGNRGNKTVNGERPLAAAAGFIRLTG